MKRKEHFIPRKGTAIAVPDGIHLTVSLFYMWIGERKSTFSILELKSTSFGNLKNIY